MARSKPGQAIRRARRRPAQLKGLDDFILEKRTTHNRFYKTVEERDAALCVTFGTFQEQPSLIVNHVARFL